MGVARLAAAPVAGVLLSVVLFARTRGLDEIAQPGQLGPGFWPRLVLAGLGVACLAKLCTELRASRRRAAAPAEAAPIDQSGLVLAIALIVLYVVATPILGFALATGAFVAAFMRLSGARSPTGIAATAVLSTVAILYVFIKLVYLPLPKGAGPAEAVTIGLYRALGIF